MGWKSLGRAMLRAPSMLIIWREKRIETSSIFHTFPPQSTIIESNTLSKEKGWRKTYRMAWYANPFIWCQHPSYLGEQLQRFWMDWLRLVADLPAGSSKLFQEQFPHQAHHWILSQLVEWGRRGWWLVGSGPRGKALHGRRGWGRAGGVPVTGCHLVRHGAGHLAEQLLLHHEGLLLLLLRGGARLIMQKFSAHIEEWIDGQYKTGGMN